MIELPAATEALARRLADAQHLPVADAIRQALEARAQATNFPVNSGHRRDASPAAIARRRARFDEAVDRIAAMPVRDTRSPREIMDDLDAL